MAKHESETWWVNHPSVAPCPECGCPVQRVKPTRRRAGTLAEGLRRHYDVVHPELGRAS